MHRRRIGRSTAKLITGIVMATTLAVGAASAQDARQRAEPDSPQVRPLKYLMVALGQDMNRINDGLWHEDYEMIRNGAQAIAGHPRVPPEQMAAIREALDERFQQFVGFDQHVHGVAVELVDAAERRDLVDILNAYTRIQNGCTSCHTAFRDEVRAKLYGHLDPSN